MGVSLQLDANEIDEVIFGNVVVNSGAPNIAREILLDAGLPRHIPGTTVVLQCLSGLECVAQAARAVEHGDAECVVAGGSDSLSSAEVPMPSKLTLALGKYAMGGGNKNGMKGVWDMLTAAGSPMGWIPGETRWVSVYLLALFVVVFGFSYACPSKATDLLMEMHRNARYRGEKHRAHYGLAR